MVAGRSLSALSVLERQAVRQQRQRSGQCIRCFHASRPTLAADNNKKTPLKAPTNGPTRKQRAAQAAEQVRMLAADLTSEGAAKPERNLPVETAIDGQSKVDLPDTMGKNMASEREGLFAQRAGRPVRTMDQDFTAHEPTRGLRAPEGTLEHPLHDGAALITRRERIQSRVRGGVASHSKRHGVPFRPTKYTKEALLRHGHNTATLAGGNYAGIVSDRMSTVGSTSMTANERDHVSPLKVGAAGLVRFDTAEQWTAFEKAQGKGKSHYVRNALGLRSPVAEKLGRSLILGEHVKPLSSPMENSRSRTMAAVENVTRLNGTYHSDDTDRLKAIVQKSIPSPKTAAAAGKATLKPAAAAAGAAKAANPA